MYEPKLARFTSRDPLLENHLDIFYPVPDMRQYWTSQVREHEYVYALNDPVNRTDPSGLQALPPGACAGTDCVYPGGIKTTPNPNADESCKRTCKALIVEAHESAHRKNMGSCCDALNKCIEEARKAPNRRLEQRLERVCRGLWNLWKNVNRPNLELRAGAESCEMVKHLVNLTCDLPAGPPLFLLGCRVCCQDARDQAYLCQGNDPNAKIECCPFDATGFPDTNCINRLRQLSTQNPKP